MGHVAVQCPRRTGRGLATALLALVITGCAGLGPTEAPEAGADEATPSAASADEGDDEAAADAEETASQSQQEPDDTAETAEAEAQEQAAQRQPERLTGENLYRLLVADLAGRQGQLGVALQGYLETAGDTRDPRVAERATQLALYAERYEAAFEAAQRWAELAPDSQGPHQALARLYLRRGEAGSAERELVRLLELSGQEQGGWSTVSSILVDSPGVDTALAVAAALTRRWDGRARPHYIVAQLAAEAGNTDRALRALERALERKPGYADALVLRARILTNEGRTDEALARLREAYRASPGNQSLALGYVRMLVEAGRTDTARDAMERVHERFGDDADAVYTLGLLAMQAELWADARLYLERLVQMDAKASRARYYLGRIAQQQGDCQRALQHYIKVGDGQRRFDARLRAGVCMAELGRREEARLHFERMRSRFDSQSALTQIALTAARIEREAGEAQRAMAVLNDALERFPESQDLLYARALTAVALDRVDRARRDLEAVLERDPDNARALNALGYTLANRDLDLERAHDLIERALEQNPDDPATLDSMGWVLYRQGRSNEAVDYLRRAWQRHKDPEIAAHLGEVLWVLGQRDEARRIWREGRDQGSDHGVIDETIERLTQ
jgi:tetratricopeptide (TPR) repeat protein